MDIKKINKKNIFAAANPLQILIATSLIRQLRIANESTLIIHGGFIGAKEIFYRFKTEDVGIKGAKVIYLDRRGDVFRWVGQAAPEKLFVDGDVGFKNFINLILLKFFNPKMAICVFEEGIGTYRNDLYNGLKRKLFGLLGIGINFGGSVLTSRVYVTNPDRYKTVFPNLSQKVYTLDESPRKILTNYQKSWEKIFDYQQINAEPSNNCSVYLTSWNIDEDSINKMMSNQGDKYIKLHPRCLDQVRTPGVTILKATAPAELIIADLSGKYKAINVYHHGSSVAQYFSETNVNFIQL